MIAGRATGGGAPLAGVSPGGSGGAQALIHRNISPNPASMRVPGRLSMPKAAWEEGRIAGAMSIAKCPYSVASVDGWAWSAGYVEGRADVAKSTG